MKKIFTALIAVLMVGLSSTAVVASESNLETNSQYELYPVPQNEHELDSEFTLTDDVNVVIGDEIDEPTKDLLHEILESKSLEVTISDQVVSDKTNIIIGTKDSDSYVDHYFNENVDYDESIFQEVDPYILTMDKDLEEKGTIGILGNDTDAAYYGLASLKIIFEQLSDNTIQSMTYEDYSDTKLRGFIEGFYGIPWSHEDRISLMEFGGELKMNSYIFGPKDDKYHNSHWRDLYPENELEKIEELATVGNETKNNFIWAIHPGFNMIDWDDYDNELDTLLTKLEQLYDVGVRQFGVFLDDINLNQSLENTDEHVKLITDVANWADSKEGVKSLVYTPPFYNQDWTGQAGIPYLEAFKDVPDNVEIMWTGDDVLGSVNSEDMQWVKDLIDRDPFVWLNWPVNGHSPSKLMLGKGELLKPGTHNISGVVTNPLEQAELSKIALFAVSDYSWNVDDFDDDQSWKDSFKYVEPKTPESLQLIASHLSDPSPSNRGLVLEESEYLKEDLNNFIERFENDEAIDEIAENLTSEFDDVLDAIKNFEEKSDNEHMKKEIEPWLNSLRYVVKADKYAAKSVMALQNENMNKAWEEFAKASKALAESKEFTVEKVDGSDLTVESGGKRLVPFANTLLEQLDAKLLTQFDPQAVNKLPLSSYENQSLEKMIDGDEETFSYIKTRQENGDWYGLDLGKPVQVDNITILQGRDDEDHDIFHKGILEYSLDGENWEAIGDERSGNLVEAEDLNVEARYVRYRLTHAGVPGGKPDLWTAIREFKVNDDAESIYTNVEKLADVELKTTETSAEMEAIQDVVLKPTEYAGMELKSIESIQDIEVELDTSDLTLETSENGVEWTEVTESDSYYSNATYVRLINKSDEEVSFDINKFLVSLNKFTDPEINHNYQGVYDGKLENIFNGDLSSKLWLEGKQDEGKYLEVDMGGIVNVEDVGVVINDGENDFFKEGELQLSTDGESWETIHTFSHPEDIGLNFPEHEAPYRYKRVDVDNQNARYVRLLSTGNHSKWLALNQIIVNEGQKLPTKEDLTINADPVGKDGYEASQSRDQKLSTFYTPQGEQESGHLNYKLSRETELSDVVVLQNPEAISNAKVTIRDEDGWHQVGELDESLNMFDTSQYEHVLEIELEWSGTVKPQIHEIITAKKQTPTADKVEDIQNLVEQFSAAGEFEDEQSVHTLNLHLTAVSHYEKQEAADKIVKHLHGFKDLLNHQKENKLISEKAYDKLVIATDLLIEKWQ